MLGADELMMRIHAAMAQKDRELVSERTSAVLARSRRPAARRWGRYKGFLPASCHPDAAAAALAQRGVAEQAAHRLALEIAALRAEGVRGKRR
jgi:DNA invertase Pin-like site-specific DNA recombinase